MGLLQSCFPRKPEALAVCTCFSAGGRKRGGAVHLSVARPAPGFLPAGLLSLRSSPQRLILGAVGRLCGWSSQEQSVDALAAWLCLVLELGAQGQRCCWPWRGGVWRRVLPVSAWGCFQHRSQTSPSSSWLAIGQPGPSSCRQGKEK